MPINLSKAAKQKGIDYFLISFTDLFGVMRAKLVPAAAIAGMQKDRIRICSGCPTPRA
jgi:glutamine synthetase